MKQDFSLDLSGKDQAVLLSIVAQIVNGDVKIIQKDHPPTKQNNYMAQEDTKAKKSHQNTWN